MKHRIMNLGATLLLSVAPTLAQDWKPAAGPLKTRWAKDVSPTQALPEYPRMQMVRKDWLNLNGLWSLQLADGTPTQILVPYPVESALSGVMKHSERMTYRRWFEVPKTWAHRRVLLHFGAVDWEAKVRVNGQELGVHRGGYDAFSFDLTEALKPNGPQELRVEVFDPTDSGDQPHGKQAIKPGDITYTATSGIWQTVWLEPVPKEHIESLHIVPDVDAECVYLTVTGSGTAEVVVKDGGRKVGHAKGAAGAPMRIRLRNPRLWSPDSPHLYDLQIRCGQDEVSSYFGMRKIGLGKDPHSRTRILLNNRFIFQRGPLDQGFWPDGLYTAPTDEALRYDIEMTKRLGFNMTRKHIKVEPDRWYYWCDKLGLLVWQDMVSGHNQTAAGRRQFEDELAAMILGCGNHPSIVMWEVFNEGWGQFDTERLTALVKKWDPTRLVDNATGGVDKGVGDVVDVHGVESARAPESNRASVVGESMGVYWSAEGHTWRPPGTPASPRELGRLENTYRRYMHEFWDLRDHLGLSAYIYTQLTDVEGEVNGLLTYDRLPRDDLDRIAAANQGKGNLTVEVVPTSRKQGVHWRFTVTQPDPAWFKPTYADSAWQEGPGGFGTSATPGAVVRTEWKTSDIWLRRSFEWPERKIQNPTLLIHHDEDVEVYLNGVLAGEAAGYTSDYEELALTPAGLAALKPGKNVLAVHCHQTVGGQYIDVGMASQTAQPQP